MKKYIINANKHSSKLFRFLPHIGFTLKNKINFSVKFDKSCLYDLYNNDNYDTNKLHGVSTSYNHMIQSARFGWRCLDNKNIEILTFVHDNHKFLEPQVLCTIKPDEWLDCCLEIKDYSYIFSIKKDNISNNIEVFLNSKTYKFKYKLFFYFGGNQTAPHDMWIYIM